METVIKNWIEQDKLYGLDYSSAKATVGDYTFDIRYDCDLPNPHNRPERYERILSLTISYKNNIIVSKPAKSIEILKNFSEQWLKQEVLEYYYKHCILLKDELPYNISKTDKGPYKRWGV